MKAIAAAICAGMLLVGCRTAQQVETDQVARMQSVVGLTMAEFTARTGLAPVDAIRQSDTSRIFIVPGRTVTMSVAQTPGWYGAPAVSSTETCRFMVHAAFAGGAHASESWRITRVEYRGPCYDTI